MPSPSSENLDDFLDTDDQGGFALVAVFCLQVGGKIAVNGIFEDATLNAMTGEYEADIMNPRFVCKAADVVDVNRFDTVSISGVSYKVTNPPLDDGTGMTTVRLAPVDPPI